MRLITNDQKRARGQGMDEKMDVWPRNNLTESLNAKRRIKRFVYAPAIWFSSPPNRKLAKDDDEVIPCTPALAHTRPQRDEEKKKA